MAALVVAGVGLRPAEARACSYDPGAHTIVPSGAEHPANAAVMLVGALLRTDDLSATIDGVPVEIVVDETLERRHDGSLADHWLILPLRFDPAPSPGQTVTVTGNACGPGGNCNELDVAYVATEPDEIIADAEPTLAFDLVRFSDPAGTSCGSWGSFVHTTSTIDEAAFADEAFVIYDVVARNDGAGLQGTSRYQASWLQFDPDVLFAPDVVGDAFPLEGWCVDIRMIDAAGNGGTVATSCDACMFYDGPPIAQVDEIPFAPVPGGPCDPGGGSSSGAANDEGSTGADDTSTSAAADDDETPLPEPGDGSTSETTSPSAVEDDGATERGCACAPAQRSDRAAGFALLLLAALRRER